MQRRDFMKLAGATGLMLSFGGREGRSEDAYAGPFYININADGGWDPSSLFDPKGAPINSYDPAEIKELGPFRYAPYKGPARTVVDPVTGANDDQPFFDRFFTNHGKDLLVIRGLDMSTNSHVTGQAYTWGGKLGQRWPSLPALAAAAGRPDLPMAYISNGGYSETDGLVAATRTGNAAGFVGNLGLAADPNRVALAGAGRFQDDGIWNNLIRPAMNQRLQVLEQANPSAPVSRRASILHAVRTSPSSLSGLAQFLPAKGLTKSPNTLFAQIDLATAAFKIGASVGASLIIGGFDTHDNHDARHFPRLDDLLRGIDYLRHRLSELGLLELTTIVIGSDFGRTPLYENGTKGYNLNLGKDHHSITGAMFLGRGISGGRMIGGTDDKLAPLKVNPNDLSLDPQNGIILRPEHIHQELRHLAGLDSHPILASYLIDVPLLGLFKGP